jgi:cobalamin synthase
VPTLLVYAALIVPRALSEPVADIDWVLPMVGAIVGFVIANVLGNVVAAMTNAREADQHDDRDTEIDRFGERIGNWAIAIGAIAGLILAMAEADPFWIANAIFLGFLAGAVVSAAAKIAAYHGSFQRW